MTTKQIPNHALDVHKLTDARHLITWRVIRSRISKMSSSSSTASVAEAAEGAQAEAGRQAAARQGASAPGDLIYIDLRATSSNLHLK